MFTTQFVVIQSFESGRISVIDCHFESSVKVIIENNSKQNFVIRTTVWDNLERKVIQDIQHKR